MANRGDIQRIANRLSMLMQEPGAKGWNCSEGLSDLSDYVEAIEEAGLETDDYKRAEKALSVAEQMRETIDARLRACNSISETVGDLRHDLMRTASVYHNGSGQPFKLESSDTVAAALIIAGAIVLARLLR